MHDIVHEGTCVKVIIAITYSEQKHRVIRWLKTHLELVLQRITRAMCGISIIYPRAGLRLQQAG